MTKQQRSEETKDQAATETAAETFLPPGAEVEPAPRRDEDTSPTEEPAPVVTNGPRNPERCVVYHPGARRFALERGCVVEEEGKVTGLEVPEGAEDVVVALASLEALRLAEIARRYDREVIRVEQVGSGPLVAAALREAGFHVVEFPG